MVQRLFGKKRFLARFQDGCEKDMASNQLTVVIVDKNPVEEGREVPTIPEITDYTVPLEKGCYHGFHVVLIFHE